MPSLLDFPPELISTIGNELGAHRKVFRIICKQINEVLAPNVLSVLVIDLPRKVEPTLALLEELAKSTENPTPWELYVRRLEITALYPTYHAVWTTATTRKCSSHLRRHLQLAIASLKNLRHISWDIGREKEPSWVHGVLVAGLAILPNLQSMKVTMRYCRDVRELKLERMSTLSSLEFVFEDHYFNSSKHKPELLGLPHVIANNHSLKRLDILIKAFRNAPQSKISLNELLDERSLSIEPRERLNHLGLWGIIPKLSKATIQQLRFLRSITVHSHDVGGGTDNVENFWGSLLEERVELEEIVTDRMTVGLGRYLKGSRGLRKLEFLGAQLGSPPSKDSAECFYQDILPRLAPTLYWLVLDASWDVCWCIDPDAIKHLSQCAELRYLAVTVNGILHAKPDDASNNVVLLMKMVSENLRYLQRLKIGMTQEPDIARFVSSRRNIKSCILNYRSQLQRIALPDVLHVNMLFHPVESADGSVRYAGILSR